MIRVRVPGRRAARRSSGCDAGRARRATTRNGTMRLTTRQTFQFHGVIKTNLKRTIKAINEALLDTIAACGDVNRNVMCNPNPYQSEAHADGAASSRSDISDHLTPQTRAYHEIWLDGEKIAGGEPEEIEPIYGKTYLPRKFKIVVAVPPSNDVDIFAHDLGFIAIVEDGERVVGYNVTVGGGMGMTHGEPDTYPRIADVMGFCARPTGGRRRRKGRAPCSATSATAPTASTRGSNTPSRTVASTGSAPRSSSALGCEARSAEPFSVHATRATATAGPRATTASAHLTLFVAERPHPGHGRRLPRCSPACARSPKSTRATSGSPRTRT